VRRTILLIAAALLAAASAVLVVLLPDRIAAHLNPTHGQPRIEVSAAARELHRQLVVADLHADSLLWHRDLLERRSYGHVDLPRLIEGNVALQAFTIVTKTPIRIELDHNDPGSDAIRWLFIAQARPFATWRSLTSRALHQAAMFQRAAARSAERLRFIRTSAELREYLDRRGSAPNNAAGILGIEGAHALDGKLANLDALFDAGIRMMAPAHLADNDVAGSAQGRSKGGLTPLGREMIRRMETLKMTVDLAHASERAFDEAIAMAARPVVVSHTGGRGTCDNARNLSDDQLRAVARTGGVVGIGYWPTATCGTDAAAVARAIRHAVEVAGIEHVGLGSDFDGAVSQPFDAAGVVQITDALLKSGFSAAEIAAVMGANVRRVLESNLP
jgi:microsomal dipeptidase-like Zn-dependent dipeptidase